MPGATLRASAAGVIITLALLAVQIIHSIDALSACGGAG